jgi:hypothetical protein
MILSTFFHLEIQFNSRYLERSFNLIKYFTLIQGIWNDQVDHFGMGIFPRELGVLEVREMEFWLQNANGVEVDRSLRERIYEDINNPTPSVTPTVGTGKLNDAYSTQDTELKETELKQTELKEKLRSQRQRRREYFKANNSNNLQTCAADLVAWNVLCALNFKMSEAIRINFQNLKTY